MYFKNSSYYIKNYLKANQKIELQKIIVPKNKNNVFSFILYLIIQLVENV